MFNKEEYWERRRKGLSGTVKHNPVVKNHTPMEWYVIKRAERKEKELENGRDNLRKTKSIS